MKRKTQEQFIIQAREIHGNKYDYSSVEYKKNNIPVKIICPKHGEFTQTPNAHLNGHDCKKCGIDSQAKKITSNTNRFIEKAKKVHGDKYDYSKVEYKHSQTEVIIICSKHGEFTQTPKNHLKERGCGKCVGRNKTTQDLIAEFSSIHGDKYDYSLVKYKNAITKVKIICSKHGEFTQTPHAHLQAHGCEKCINKNETKTGEILTELLPNISLKRQLSWGKIFNFKLNRKCDFYFEKDGQKYIVEYNGVQHYQPKQFGNMSLSIAKENFKQQQFRDQQLRDLCKKHNINLIEIDGREYQGSKIKDYLEKELSEIMKPKL